jgi:hypothetical protein
MTNEQLEALIVGLTSIKKQKWFVRSEVEAIVAAALASQGAEPQPCEACGGIAGHWLPECKAASAIGRETRAMRMLWDDQSAEERAHYLAVIDRATQGDKEQA